MKKFEIKNTWCYIQILLSSFFPIASLERRSQSVVIMSNSTTNPKILNMLQDPTFQNQFKTHLNRWKNIDSCIIGYDIGCRIITWRSWIPLSDHRWWDRWPGVAVLIEAPRNTPLLADKGHKLAVCWWNRRLQRRSHRDNHRNHHRKHDADRKSSDFARRFIRPNPNQLNRKIQKKG